MMIQKQTQVGKIVLYIFLIFLALLSLFPFYMMMVNSTRTNTEIAKNVWLVPGTALSENYEIMQESVNIWRGFVASVLITIPSVLLSAFFSAMTAYGFAKFHFKGKKALFWFILATMMIPSQLNLIGYYQLIANFGLIDTYLPLILPTAANAAMVFFVRSYIESSISDSLIEAAIIDGAGESFIFLRLIIPLAFPSIATMSIFTFINKWNDLINPLVLLNSSDKFPMPIVVANIQGLYQTNYGAIYLGVAISVIPIILVVVIFSKSIIRGLTVGAIKG